MSQSRPPRSTPGSSGEPGPRRDPAAVLAASTFSTGLLLLPGALQTDARRLYHMLRTVDDLVDEEHPQAEERVAAIESWARESPARSPETLVLERLSQHYPLSRQAILDFCMGMRHDLEGAEIETEADLRRYCYQVGGTVGLMLAGLLGTSHRDGERKMAILGSAMQWTNILRDIDEDHENGRVYIARTTIERFGLPAPGKREALLRDQIPRIDALYEDGLGAIALLRNGQRAMRLSTAFYQEILRQIERDGFGRKPGRSTVPAWRKRLLAAQHTTLSLPRHGAAAAPRTGRRS